MEYNYIYKNQFVTSDEPLDSTKYQIGSTINDYINGMYVPLNEQQVQYEEEHPSASPDEVFLMREISDKIHVNTLSEKAEIYYNDNHNFIIVNGVNHRFWGYQDLIFNAECLLSKNRETFVFNCDGTLYTGSPQQIIDMMKTIAVYYYDIGVVLRQHLRYLENNPDDSEYDYTTGYPEIPSFQLEEVV